MLGKILTYLSAKIATTNYFEKIFPFAELIKDGDKTYPAYYTTKGQYEPVNNFDHYNGMAYFRQTGRANMFKAEDGNGCDIVMQIEYPMRLVACVPKEKLSCDDAFADEVVSIGLLSTLTDEGGTIKGDIKANYISFIPNGVEKDNIKILSEEYDSVVGLKDVNYKYSYHAIDFTITVRIKLSCIENECDVTGVFIPPEGEECFFNNCAELKAYIDNVAGGLNCESLLGCSIIINFEDRITALENNPPSGLTCNDLPNCQAIQDLVQVDTDNATNIANHIADTTNPHSVTKTQVGLANVTDDAQLKIASNLSDLGNVVTTRTNLGLGDSATKNVGTVAGTVAEGDDVRFTDDRIPLAHAATHTNGVDDIQDATAAQKGLLTAADWSTFNAKQSALGFTPENVANKSTDVNTDQASNTKYPSVKAVFDWATGLFATIASLSSYVLGNGAITGATKTKITYDSKGLVTAGADATTADIADSSNKRYVTDAQQTVIGNTSGTNSGNETAASIGAIVNAATNYTTPLDADKIGIWDTLNGLFKAVTWANIKATLKTYFDTLYSAPETASTIGTVVNGAGAATPNDTDLVTTVESSVVKKITWTNVKAFLKTYFDTIYSKFEGKQDYSATSTIVGFSSFTTKRIEYNLNAISKIAIIEVSLVGAGTGAAVTFTLPFNISTSTNFPISVQNNGGAFVISVGATGTGSATITIFATAAAGGWTGTGIRTVSGCITAFVQ